MSGSSALIQLPRRRESAWSRFVRNPLGVVAVIILAGVILACASALVLPLPDPNLIDVRNAMQPPSAEHLLGTDASGRDVLSRLLWGGQINLLGAALAMAVALVVGLPTGLLAGYYRGWFDGAANWVNNLNMALPGIVVLLAVRAVAGPSIWISMAVFGVMLAPGIFRVTRAAVLSVRSELYVDAAKVAGLSDARIIGKHILVVVRAPVIIQLARVASIAIAIQAGLEFLGITDSTVPSWGSMLNEAFRRIYSSPLLVLWPSLAIGLTSLALVLLANALRDALEGGSLAVASPRSQRPSAPSARAAGMSGTESGTTSGAEPAPAADTLLAVRDLEVAYGEGAGRTTVVHGVSLDIRPGEVLGLVGESGSGKSQTAFSILGLLPDGGRVSGGSIRFADRELTEMTPQQRRRLLGTEIAYVPQEPMSNLDPSFTIGQQLTVPLRARRGLSRQAARERVLALLARVGIPDPEKTFRSYPHQVSGGMAQRVLIAGAVAGEPRLLIADEPTTALDVTVQAEVLGLLRDLQRETGVAVLLVTHNFGVVADLCDRVAVMRGGVIVETGITDQVLTAPSEPYTRELLDSMLEDGPVREFHASATGRAGATNGDGGAS